MPYLRVKNELSLIPGYSEGAIAYAPDAADAPLNECICYINPEQSGSGDPSPSNVRPITGYTELNLVHTGKNLANFTDGYGISTTGEIVENAKRTTTITPIKIDSGKSYVFSFTGTNIVGAYAVWNNGTLVRRVVGFGGGVVNTTDGTELYVSCYNSGESSSTPAVVKSYCNPQLEVGSSATTYEPYTGTTTTTDLGTTVYGGTLDVVSGVLTVTHEIKTCKWSDGVSSTDLGSYIKRRFPFSSSNYGKYPPTSLDYIMCDKAPYLYNFNSDTLHFYYNSNEVLLFMPEDTDGDTIISVTFELATPITTQLTPQEVKSLLGSNNFYHDCNGDTKITYIRRLDS